MQGGVEQMKNSTMHFADRVFSELQGLKLQRTPKAIQTSLDLSRPHFETKGVLQYLDNCPDEPV